MQNTLLSKDRFGTPWDFENMDYLGPVTATAITGRNNRQDLSHRQRNPLRDIKNSSTGAPQHSTSSRISSSIPTLSVKHRKNSFPRHRHPPLPSYTSQYSSRDPIAKPQAPRLYQPQGPPSFSEVPPPKFDITKLWDQVRAQNAIMAPRGSLPTASTSSSPYPTPATSKINRPSIAREDGYQLEEILETMVSKVETSFPEDPNFTIQLTEEGISEWAAECKAWMRSRVRTANEIATFFQHRLFEDRSKSVGPPIGFDFGYCENKWQPSPKRLSLSCKSDMVDENNYHEDTHNHAKNSRPWTISYGLAITQSLPGIPTLLLWNIEVPSSLDVDRNFFADFLHVIVGNNSTGDMFENWQSRAVEVLMGQLSLQRARKESTDERAAVIMDSDYYGYIIRESKVEIWKMECRLPMTRQLSMSKPRMAPTTSGNPKEKSRGSRISSQRATSATRSMIVQPRKINKSRSLSSKPIRHPLFESPYLLSQNSSVIPNPILTQEPTDNNPTSPYPPSQFFHFTTYGPINLSLEKGDDLQKLKMYHLAIMKWAQKVHCPRYIANLEGLLWRKENSRMNFTMGDIEVLEYWGKAIGEGKTKKDRSLREGESEPEGKTEAGATGEGKDRAKSGTQEDETDKGNKKLGDRDEENQKDETKEVADGVDKDRPNRES